MARAPSPGAACPWRCGSGRARRAAARSSRSRPGRSRSCGPGAAGTARPAAPRARAGSRTASRTRRRRRCGWPGRPRCPSGPTAQAASTMATPRVSSPTPSRRWCGSRSRAPRPTARAANPTAPATSDPGGRDHLAGPATRITTGSRGGGPGPGGPSPIDLGPYGLCPYPAYPAGFRLLFFFGAERVWLPCPCLRRGAGRATVTSRWPSASRRLGGSLVQPAARAGRSVTGTGRHSTTVARTRDRSQTPDRGVSLTAKACSGSGASRGSRIAGRARGPRRWSSRPGAGSGVPPGRPPRRPGPR